MTATGYRINQVKLRALTEAVEESGRDLEREIAASINATATKGVSLTAKEVVTVLKVKQKAVKQQTRKGRRATASFPNTKIVLKKSSRIPLKEFGARQTKKGVSYKISKKGKRETITSGFVSNKLGDHVFVRVGKSRLPLRKPMGPSPWGVFVRQKMKPEVQEQVEVELEKQLDRRINFNKLKASGTI